MKKIIFTALLFCSMQLSAACWDFLCPDNYYVSLFGAANFKKDVHHKYDDFKVNYDYNVGYLTSIALGSSHAPVRIEGEFGYTRNTAHKLKIDEYHVKLGGYFRTFYGMGNLYYDFQLPSCCCGLKPYLGAGIGYANCKNRLDHPQVGVTQKGQKGFAWQLIAGVCYPLCDWLQLFTEYRYFNTHVKQDHNHVIGGGLRFFF